ncbi:hypothetical protein N7474_008631 [Penicillium riverlandense]|uniref:uncharacterized protein n=1 Tax=Penicillium riverlandense TaxID=1903569 RepID=UPI002548382B|nr:uncharacterized protein N7474_008631 [Penicillium riverlandense]KAJ5812330.1 hypothetical protein N7474_008631 [Penicillium riverlandense]
MDKALSQPRTVAVVGSGMAGLVTAHLLHQDRQERFRVTVLEKVSRVTPTESGRGVTNTATQRKQISLSAESIALPSDENDEPIWADVPMRAFAGGFYHHLIRMYDYLGVKYHSQPFLFSFTRLPRRPQRESIPSPRMIYASNFHRLPPIPRTQDLVQWMLEAAFAMLCYFWFTICVFLVTPVAEDLQSGSAGESLDAYLRRIHLPRSYVADYLLPLISSVCTCSHEELLQFPASDVLEYKRRTHYQQHYVVSGGVRSVQDMLLQGLDVRLGVELTSVSPQDTGVDIQYRTPDGRSESEHFDLIVLAVSPDIAASLFPRLNKPLSSIPTTTVETVAHTDESSIRPMLQATASSSSLSLGKKSLATQTRTTQRIHILSTHLTTESVHEQPNSIFVTTNPIFHPDQSKVIRSARFTRVLRSPHSRMLVNSLFQDPLKKSSSSLHSWRSGDDGVYLAGGWCWDGMVLLEGCIVSAMRIAKDLGVCIPWQMEE